MLTVKEYLERLEELDNSNFNGLCADTYMQRYVILIDSKEKYDRIFKEKYLEYVYAMDLNEYNSLSETDKKNVTICYNDNWEGAGLYDFWEGNDVECSYLYSLDTAIKELKKLN